MMSEVNCHVCKGGIIKIKVTDELRDCVASWWVSFTCDRCKTVYYRPDIGEICSECKGRGIHPLGDRHAQCLTCNGRGHITILK